MRRAQIVVLTGVTNPNRRLYGVRSDDFTLGAQCRGGDMAGANDTKIIGYFAYARSSEVFCDGDACIIAGSEIDLKRYLRALADDVAEQYTVRKTKFSEVMRGMSVGAAYAFDETAYNRFYPLANAEGLDFGPEDFSGPSPTGRHFVRVQVKFRT